MLNTPTTGPDNDPHNRNVSKKILVTKYAPDSDGYMCIAVSRHEPPAVTTTPTSTKFSKSAGSYLSVSTSSSNSSSDSGTSSDCGKDLVKRKRYTTAKTHNRSDVADVAALAVGRRASAHQDSASLTLVKNSASLIFTKKISSGSSSPPVVHRKRETTRGGGRRENRSSLHGVGEYGGGGAAGVETVLRKERTQSWYASLYTTLDEEVELDPATVIDIYNFEL